MTNIHSNGNDKTFQALSLGVNGPEAGPSQDSNARAATLCFNSDGIFRQTKSLSFSPRLRRTDLILQNLCLLQADIMGPRKLSGLRDLAESLSK